MHSSIPGLFNYFIIIIGEFERINCHLRLQNFINNKTTPFKVNEVRTLKLLVMVNL
jgi:hypothetical protein